MQPLRFQVLGPVQTVTAHGEPVTFPRRQVRAVLAILLLEHNRMVTVQRLCDLLWDGDQPESALPAVRCTVARLRAGLAGIAAGGPVALVSRRHGYSLEVEAEAVDAERFRRLLRRARQVHDLAARERLLGEALCLWRGVALQDCVSEPLRLRLCAELDELRMYAIEARMTTGLALGRHRDLLPELARLTAEHPTHEGLAEQYMRALHRAGRRADALRVFSRVRAGLVENFGLDPGTSLQHAHLEILNS